MMDSKIRLKIIDQAVTVDRDTPPKGVSIKFSGPDGRHISLAFDGRYDSNSLWGNLVVKTFMPYADCPLVGNEGEQSGSISDLQAMRLLRDELIALNLGKFDPSVTCSECGKRYVPSNRVSSRVCSRCREN